MIIAKIHHSQEVAGIKKSIMISLENTKVVKVLEILQMSTLNAEGIQMSFYISLRNALLDSLNHLK